MAGFLKFSSIALKNLFSKPATANYPDQPPKSTSRSRGSVQIDVEKCVFCGLCMRRCPSEAIKVDRAAKSWSIERMGCVQCADCVSVCPKQCLSMNPKYTTPSPTKTVDTFRKVEPEGTPDEMVAVKKSESALTVDIDSCVLCGLCVKQCPVGAITVDRATKTWTIDRTNCLLCGACAQRCPKKCLTLTEATEQVKQTSVYAKADQPAAVKPAPAESTPVKQPVEAKRAVLNDMESCVLCGLCVKQCPVSAIGVDRAAKSWTIDRDECLLCGACAQRCPKKCLTLAEASEEECKTSVYTKALPEVKPTPASAPAPAPEAEAKVSEEKTLSALQLTLESCVFCGLCAKQCPEEAIKVDRTAKSWEVDRERCLLCGACVQRCPKKSLRIDEADRSGEAIPSRYVKESALRPEAEAAPKQPNEHKSALHIGIENCVLCGMCVKQCPIGAITVDREAKSWSVDREACRLCGACVQRCPKKCLGIGHASESTLQISTYTKS